MLPAHVIGKGNHSRTRHLTRQLTNAGTFRTDAKVRWVVLLLGHLRLGRE